MEKKRAQTTNRMNQGEPLGANNCYDCARFFITHDRHYPYGCRAMGFKSAQRPSSTVVLSSGFPCQMFMFKRKRA